MSGEQRCTSAVAVASIAAIPAAAAAAIQLATALLQKMPNEQMTAPVSDRHH